MTLCPDCVERDRCKEICPAVKQEITGRGITASRKPKTYPVDFSYIEDTHQSLNPFQRDVLRTLKNLTSCIKTQLLTNLEIEEAINKSLNDREKEVILLFMHNYKQQDIAEKLSVSQPRVNFLLKKALKKIKIYLGGYKIASKSLLPLGGQRDGQIRK